MHSYGWVESKKGFFDDEDEDNLKDNDLWGDNDPFGE